MPYVLLLAAICTGLTLSIVWMGLGGSALMAFVLYVLSGNLVVAGFLANIAIRGHD